VRGGVGSLAATVAVAALAGACAEPEAEVASFEVTDSAGIRIVRNLGASGVRGQLSSVPSATIGTDSLTLYQVAGGILTSDGGFVLVSSGDQQLLYFDGDGAFVRRAGARGDGPGEFQSISWIRGRADGGLTLADARANRVTALGAAGELMWVRPFNPTVPPKPDPRAFITPPSPLAALDDGRILGFPVTFTIPDGVAGPMPTVGTLMLYAPDLTQLADLGPVTLIMHWEDPTAQMPFARYLGAARVHFAARGDRFAYTDIVGPSVNVVDGGARTMIIRENRSRHPFVPDSIPRGAFAVDSLPTYQDIKVDARGRVWTLVAPPSEGVDREWRLFGVDGVAVGSLLLPADAVLLDADDTRVLLLRRDDFEVETVELWDVSWSEP